MENNSLTLDKLFHLPNHQNLSSGDTTYVGIDFGTSTTVVSIANFNANSGSVACSSLILPQSDKNGNTMEGELYPTVIAMTETGRPLVGQGAYYHKWDTEYIFGQNIWYSFKMELGIDLGPRWNDSKQAQIKSPKDATKVFFRILKKSIEKAITDLGLSQNIKYAVSIPASFESNQRRDLMDALKDNNIEVDGSLFIDEPNAAFIGYVADNYSCNEPIILKDGYNPKVLVFDFGAGTCDISILELRADYHGLHSRNLSISKFAELGGNDIDRYIAYNILLPQLLTANGLKNDDFSKKQLEFIANQLMGIAENLKIQLCKEDFNYLLSDPDVMNQMVKDEASRTIDTSFLAIRTNHESLTIPSMRITYGEFIDAMNVFFKKHFFSDYATIKRQKRYNSIISALESAMNKAHVDKSEIDYVMMIGGSSRNPFVQSRIKKFFNEDTKILIPGDLQSLVSQGAAIHSLLCHGANTYVVRPIASEQIVMVTQEGPMRLVEAGTELPFHIKIGNGLTTGDMAYPSIHIPVCVGSDEKMILNLKLRRPNMLPFPPGSDIKLDVEMDTDKLLHISASYGDEIWQAVCENPFANAFQTDKEIAISSAQKESYISANNNGGKPSEASLKKLADAYEEAELYFDAAETLEEAAEIYPRLKYHNRIGVLYHNGGNYTKAIKHFRKALERDENNATILANLGDELFLIGDFKGARKMLSKAVELKADAPYALIWLGRLEKAEGNKEAATEYFTRAYNLLHRRWAENGLDDWEKGWFASVADETGHSDVARMVREESRRDSSRKRYDVDKTLHIDKPDKLESI